MKLMPEKFIAIGLTGCIGSGKSSVAGMFRECGVEVIDADAVARRLLAPGKPGWLGLKETFGDRFMADGRVDRPALRREIFVDPALRKEIDFLLHPMIRAGINKEVQTMKERLDGMFGFKGVVVEVPLLFEADWEADFDYSVVVVAEEKQCLERLTARDRVDLQEAEAALASQMAMAEKKERADFLIDNRGEMSETRRQVEELIRKITAAAS